MTSHPSPRTPALDLIDVLAQSIADLAKQTQEAVAELRRQDNPEGDGDDPAD